MKIQTIKFEVIEISGNQSTTIDGLNFKNCLIIKITIDGANILADGFYEDGLVVFNELRKSLDQRGDFLIFTCACGVADDGGWGLTSVNHLSDQVTWEVLRGDEIQVYRFKKENYTHEIIKLENCLSAMTKVGLRLEPENPVYPE